MKVIPNEIWTQESKISSLEMCDLRTRDEIGLVEAGRLPFKCDIVFGKRMEAAATGVLHIKVSPHSTTASHRYILIQKMHFPRILKQFAEGKPRRESQPRKVERKIGLRVHTCRV